VISEVGPAKVSGGASGGPISTSSVVGGTATSVPGSGATGMV